MSIVSRESAPATWPRTLSIPRFVVLIPLALTSA